MNKPADRPKLRDPRPPSFRNANEGDGRDEFYDLQIALALLAEDEGKGAVDALIRDASHAAADASDLQRAFRIASVADGTRVKIGAKIGCEILAALGRWLDDENGKETP